MVILNLIILYLLIKGYFEEKKKINLINKFNILVLDCEIYKLETNPDTLGCYNAKIKSKSGQEYNEIFRIREENIKIGSNCLLVCKKHPTNEKKMPS